MASQQKDPIRVAAGLKAAIHNPNVSEEAKSSANERLHEMGTDSETKGRERVNTGDEQDDVGDADSDQDNVGGGETNRVLGGYKATLKNPRVSEGAKQHAEAVLKENGAM